MKLQNNQTEKRLGNEKATCRFATALGHCLRSTDTILLSGELGTGKTFFARALIQSILVQPEEVPSPTFTLVQTYKTKLGDLWHSDLYRIAQIEEIEELGLIDAFAHSICVVEWPDRLGPLMPEEALKIEFKMLTNKALARNVILTWTDAKWTQTVTKIMSGLSSG
ncbi:MAG: tRNA (adenosine(37)-N6)-threonylcarbamoyltransferase complex ATPase subunit type 1 TsaE [Aestuariivita sp.]|nr:tRNA (adenosine(37)-N6)-threonylcarbamoyltransferase complex ATPase subunit type 1 TsaE [Aestuariivita sp.]